MEVMSDRFDEVSVEPQPFARHRWHFAPVPPSVPEVRRRLKIVLGSLGVVRDAADAALLVATELATNAVEHARTEFWVTLSIEDPGILQISVRDYSTQRLEPRPRDVFADRGRGLQVVAALGRWVCITQPDGKTVRAAILLDQE